MRAERHSMLKPVLGWRTADLCPSPPTPKPQGTPWWLKMAASFLTLPWAAWDCFNWQRHLPLPGLRLGGTGWFCLWLLELWASKEEIQLPSYRVYMERPRGLGGSSPSIIPPRHHAWVEWIAQKTPNPGEKLSWTLQTSPATSYDIPIYTTWSGRVLCPSSPWIPAPQQLKIQ